jgi:phosphoribosylaminoimidazolecarboxamide formyltransferase/IMP cyclohydrolase
MDGGTEVRKRAVTGYAEDERAGKRYRVRYGAEFRGYPRAVRWCAAEAVAVDRHAELVRVDVDADGPLPVRRLASADPHQALRYGENLYQEAAVYPDLLAEGPSVVGADQLNPDAKALSYNNYNDADAALALVREFDRPAAAVIKHANPAGCAVAGTAADAYERALGTDPMSAFGGIVALNRPCDVDTAERIIDSYKEVVVAPGFAGSAAAVLAEREDLRVLDIGAFDAGSARTRGTVEQDLAGGRLVQDRDDQGLDPDDLEVVTARTPTDAERETMAFAWPVVKHVKSNAIVLADGTETVGIGMGQVSRIDAVRLAAMKAEKDAESKGPAGSVLASDAFFPFPDGVEVAAKAGVTAVVQPGGSVNDETVIQAADEHGLAMAFTGQRAFRHG